MDKLANMEAFAQVATLGSFAGAAQKLNLATSVVSKRVSDLEAYLGAQLMQRTTRKVTLTEAGYQYLEYVRKTLDEMSELEGSLRQQAQQPVGTIKLTAPLSFGLQMLAPAIAEYVGKYPQVTFRTHLSDRRVDLVQEGFDLAIRVGRLEEQGMIARKLAHGRRVACASPAYLKKHGRPKTPNDLLKHNCISYLNLAEGKAWPFMVEGKRVWQQVSGNLLSDNGDLMYQTALAGGGITLLPTFIIAEGLRSGQLEIVLEEFEEQDFDIYAVYQHTRHLSVRIRTFIDHLTDAAQRLCEAPPSTKKKR